MSMTKDGEHKPGSPCAVGSGRASIACGKDLVSPETAKESKAAPVSSDRVKAAAETTKGSHKDL